MKENRVAILLFSRTAAAEAAAKPLVWGKRTAERMASFLIHRVQKMAHKTQLPVFFFSEKQQRGATFGERFANACEDVFALGYEKVIAIGNDCLTIATQDILNASKILESTPSVLGATKDGGAYLIGLSKEIFQKKELQNLNWQTEKVFDELIQFVEAQNITPFLLPEQTDIDHLSDWKQVLAPLSMRLKKLLIRLLFFSFPKLSTKDAPINATFLKGAMALRAPPISF